MATKFKREPAGGPSLISGEPHRDQAPEKALQPGLEHRPYSDGEIKQAFDTFDLDKNHFVGALEIRHILEIIGEEATDDEIDEMIRMCDSDGKGQVTFDEFHRMMTQPAPPPPPPAPPKTIKTKSRRSEKVNNNDSDGKPQGKNIAPAQNQARAASVESLVMKLSGGAEKIKPSQIKRIYKRFQDIDTDKTGAVDYQEFIEALEMEESTISRQMFGVFDLDGSGSISMKEFIVVLARYTSASKSEKLKFAFMMFDEDSSGFIERDELVEMMQASFVVEGYTFDELEDKANDVFQILGLPPDGRIGYEDFLTLANHKQALIYPIEEERRRLPEDVSINNPMKG